VKKHTFLLIALGLSALFPSACQKKPERPNIVVIVVDALRADHLPFYGYQKNTAPFLNQLSKHSSVFVHAHSTSNWTAPSIGSLLTSLYPFQHFINTGNPTTFTGNEDKVQVSVSAISQSISTMAEILKNCGYRTFGISSNFFIGQDRGFAQGFDYFQHYPMHADAEVLNAKVAEWQDEMRKGPYHLYIHYTDIHIPYRRRPPWYQRGKNKRDDFISAYDSNIPYVDAKIRALYRRLNWDHNTILIVTADHGEEFWEHGYRGHGHNLFSGSLRVPLLVWMPKSDRTGRRIEPNVTNIDILPTLCEYIGQKPDPQLEGRSLLPAMQGKPEYLAGRLIYAYVQRGPYRFRGILHDNWKLIMTPEGDKYYLFDLKTDPGEKNNLANKPQETDRKLEMARQYWEFEKNSRKYEQKLVEIVFTRKELEKLKSLGYIN
jgi:arylsulfatase A-like enzyme